MEKISKITYNGTVCEVKDAAARDELLQTIQTIQIDGTAQPKSNHIVDLPAYPTKESLGLGNTENKSSEQIRNELTPENITNALGYTPADESEKGQPNGVAQLDDTGRVPAAQLPSYVDDIESYDDMEHFPLTGEDSKIYIDKSTNKTYRWDGTTYIEISASLALGETSSTAYPGDKGAAAYAHAVTNKGSAFDSGLYKIGTNSEGHVTSATSVVKEDILALGIEDTDTKVTSVDNHYLPIEDTEAELEVEADDGETAQWGLTNLVKGITLKRDAKGHVVGIDVISSRMPAEPSAQGTYEVVTGDANGQIKVIPPSGNSYNVDVKGLGSAAYTDSSTYATAAQGEKADNAITTRAELIDKLGYEPADDDDVVTLVKVGEDEYVPDDGVVSLPAYPTKASLGLDNVENKSASDILSELDDSNITNALGYTPATAEQGDKADTAIQNIKINGAIQEKIDNTVDLPAYPTKESLGLDKVENKTADEIIGELTSNDVTDALGYTPATSEQGSKADSAVQTIKIGTETIENVGGTVTLPTYPTKASLGLGSAAELDVPATTGAAATATEAVRGDDPRLSNARPASDVSAWAKEATKPSYSAAEIGALSDSTKYGSAIGMTLDDTTYEITIQLKDQDGNALGAAQSIDLPLESVVVGGSYDSVNKKIVLTLKNGNTVDVPVGDLIAGLQSEITSNNMLDADLVDDTTSTHKFATAAQLAQIATNTAAIEDKADKTDLPSSPSDIGAATAAQGEKADTAVQTIQIGGTTQTKTNGVVNLPAYPTVPTSLKNPYSLTVQGNGTQAFTYNGSSSKTLNIKAGTNITINSDTSGNITINGAAGTSYDAGTGLSLSGSTFNHSNSITPGTASGSATTTLNYGGSFSMPTVSYDAQGHITGKGTTTITLPAKPTAATVSAVRYDTASQGLTGTQQSNARTNLGLGSAATADSSDYASASHNQASNSINAMTGYTKPSSTSAISTSDTLNGAIGKLEKALDNKVSSSSLSSYLPLAGGTMTGQINGATTGGKWVDGRTVSSLKKTAPTTTDAYYPILDMNSYSGDWSIGTHPSSVSGEDLFFVHVLDTDYSGGTNRSRRYYLESGGTTSSTHDASYAIIHSGNIINYAAGSATMLNHKTLTDTTLNNTAGTFAFSGNSGASGTFPSCDWVGLQVGNNLDKFQLTTGNGQGTLLVRSNDAGGTSTAWSDWATLVTSANIGTYAVTPSALNDYLPLAGGTMTGDILMTGARYIQSSSKNSWLKINDTGTSTVESVLLGHSTSGNLMTAQLSLHDDGITLYAHHHSESGDGQIDFTGNNITFATLPKFNKGFESAIDIKVKNNNDNAIVVRNSNTSSAYTNPEITLNDYDNTHTLISTLEITTDGLRGEDISIYATGLSLVGTEELFISGNIYTSVLPSGGGSTLARSSEGQIVKTTSSKRVKHNIEYITNGEEYHNALMKFKPASFIYNSDKTNTTRLGMIAEDVAELCLIATIEEYEPIYDINGKKEKDVTLKKTGNVENYDDRAIIAMLVLEVQRLNKELEQLKK